MKDVLNIEFTKCGISFLISLGFLLLSGCATFGISSSELSAKLSDPADLVQVRSVFKTEAELAPLVRNVVFHNEPGEFRYIEYTDPSSNSAKVVQLTSILPDSIIVSYSPGGLNGAWKVSYTDYVQMQQYFWMLTRSQTDAENLARALNILVLDARHDRDGILAANFEKFKLTCQSWHSLQDKPPMPQEAQRHKVLAENAVREKDMDKATDEYIDALMIYPCWPEGQHNMASILGDTGRYTEAIAHMKYYLELVPNASDSQADRDKIKIWQDKMGR
ncbi:MAG TPA: hypothetical protein VIJ25_04485 [Methylococcales bacterium]